MSSGFLFSTHGASKGAEIHENIARFVDAFGYVTTIYFMLHYLYLRLGLKYICHKEMLHLSNNTTPK